MYDNESYISTNWGTKFDNLEMLILININCIIVYWVFLWNFLQPDDILIKSGKL